MYIVHLWTTLYWLKGPSAGIGAAAWRILVKGD